MADLALERGEKGTAAQHLRRLADGSGDRAERATLLEQLGDILHAVDDLEGARTAYEEALGFIGTPGETHIPLLEKTLGLQRLAGGSAKRAAATAEALIALVTDPKQRAARRREAALLLEEQSEFGRAGEFLEQALSESPGDEAVLASLASAYERAGRRLDLEAILARTLPGLEPVPAGDVKARQQRAMLWEKLGELQGGSDRAAAITALETAVAVDPERVHARELLGALYGSRPEHATAALANHRMLVASDITRASSLRTVARAYAEQGRLDWARCCLELMELLGLTDDEDKAFLETYLPPPRKPEDPYATTIEEVDHARTLAHPDARVMAEVFAAIWEGVPGLAGPSLESMGVSTADKVSPLSDVVVAQIFGQAAKALGNRRATLYVSPKPDFEGLTIAVAPPPSIVVGQNMASAPAAELRFLVGRALELTRPEYILGAAMPAKDFTHLFASVLKAFHPRHGRWRPGAQDVAVEQAAKLKKSLPYKVAKRLVELFQENGTQPFSSAHWRAVVQETGNRTGLVMCGDLATAAAVILRETLGPDAGAPSPEIFRVHAEKPGPLRELLRYAVSEDYFALRASLGTAVQHAAAAE
jgi:tetratricopeptide (TPR) repeat protein